MTQRPYRRSWRNLLLDRNYQLGFTALLVVSCAIFMAGLGVLVVREADTATKTAIQDVQGGGEASTFVDPETSRRAIESLEARHRLLVEVVIGVGVLLTIGLFVAGIKLTHHVAGPLHKIGLYVDDVHKGKWDVLRPLRKGDELVDFYEHFRGAHQALRAREERDVAVLRAVLAASTPEVAMSGPLEDLRVRLAEKEKGLG